MNKQSKCRLEDGNAFVVENYNAARPWSSFFPGIAGLYGIPLWVFYVNRGQCIASMGVRSKDEAIMEFFPANKAYQFTPSHGFRTFICVKKGRSSGIFYEPFSPAGSAYHPRIRNKLTVRAFDLTISEIHPDLGLEVEVSYFSIPHAPFAALARELTVKNISHKTVTFEFLDGLSAVVPCGVNNWFLKEMSRTIEAWMTVENVDRGVPLFKLTTDACDTAQVSFIKGAHFYTGFWGHVPRRADVIVDPVVIFGQMTDLSYPVNFTKELTFRYPRRQIAKNKMPCAFSLGSACLKPGAVMKFFSLIGHVFSVADIKALGIDRVDEDFIAKKRVENEDLIAGITDRIFTSSASEAFDHYVGQTYLDNCLRGGFPYSVDLGALKKNIYVFSRKHGDLERDYNRFHVASTYFSEGEGNYRDVNQNRRSDCFFNPLVREKTIVDFMNLIQLDGYNPLIFKGERFAIEEGDFLKSDVSKAFNAKDAQKISHILSRPFALGDILHYIQENNISCALHLEELVSGLLMLASSSQEAVFGEGYWSDHWTYNTDLLESFNAIYPDRMQNLLMDQNDFTYFDTHAFVKPRGERTVIQRGEPRQYHSIFVDDEKLALIQKRRCVKNIVRSAFGNGEVFKTTLLDKFLCLIVNKLSTLDPFGAGIEMEADKPNWYDALNGLPGLFGSSVSETFELKRLILLLKSFFYAWGVARERNMAITAEVADFLNGLWGLLKADLSLFDFWDQANILKEAYRLKVRRGVSGERRILSVGEISEFFEIALKKIDRGIAASYDEKTKYYTTYFFHRMNRHETATDEQGKHIVIAKSFEQVKLPLFLEGFVHALRTESHRARAIYRAVRKSPLWDAKLKMFKVNASLKKESFELGRAKAFTPGWLENESVWLHMEYKYILELLKNKLFPEFYENFFQALVCFKSASVYGRSPLENSSFIVSSAHPDSSLHGAGFVARLSGSTAEFIHMWRLMNMGPDPFFAEKDGALSLRFGPALSAKLFSKKARLRSYVDITGESVERLLERRTYAFLFLGRTLVIYENPEMKDTFGKDAVKPVRMTLYDKGGVVAVVEGDCLKAPYADQVRKGEITSIEIMLG